MVLIFLGTSENDTSSPDISHPLVYSETSGSYQMTELPATDKVKGEAYCVVESK
jgi:hypothetical protein